MPCGIDITDWIVQAIGKHIVAQDTLAGGNKGIGIDESADLGVIISALEIVEPRLFGAALATWAKSGHFYSACYYTRLYDNRSVFAT